MIVWYNSLYQEEKCCVIIYKIITCYTSDPSLYFWRITFICWVENWKVKKSHESEDSRITSYRVPFSSSRLLMIILFITEKTKSENVSYITITDLKEHKI